MSNYKLINIYSEKAKLHPLEYPAKKCMLLIKKTKLDRSTYPVPGCTAIPLGLIKFVAISRLDPSVTLKATTDLQLVEVQNKTLEVQS